MALLKQIKTGRLGISICTDRESMGKAAAEHAAAIFKKLLNEKEYVNAVFAAAPSQNETLRFLSEEDGIEWKIVNAFHMDEYRGLPVDAPQSFGHYLKEHIFSLVPFRSVNYINGTALSADEECERYTRLLLENPVDIVCLGIGENAHIAFNDPWEADFNDPKTVKVVRLDPVCRQQQVNDGCFAAIEDVPEQAFSLTIPALTRAAHLICTVPGPTKTEAVARTAFGPISAEIPATVMRLHADAVMFCDKDAGEKLLCGDKEQ